MEDLIKQTDTAIEQIENTGVAMAGEGRVKVFIPNIGDVYLKDPTGRDMMIARNVANQAKIEARKEGYPTKIEVLQSEYGLKVFPIEDRNRLSQLNDEIASLIKQYVDAKTKKKKADILRALYDMKPEWDRLRSIEAELTADTADEASEIIYRLAMFVLRAVDENGEYIFESIRNGKTAENVKKAIEKIKDMPIDTYLTIAYSLAVSQDIINDIPEDLRDFFF